MRRNVMIVDDDKEIHELVGFFLQQAGFEVRSVSDGISALEELNSNLFDLLIVDINMPHMSGFKFLNSMRMMEKFKHLPVIMLTGSDDKKDILRVKNDVSDYILKPPKRDDLLARIERILGGKPQFEEVKFRAGDSTSAGMFEVPIKMVSLSRTGMIINAPVGVNKNFILQSLSIGLFKKLEIKQEKFKVTDCKALGDGGFEFFVSFIGMNKLDQEKIHQWIIEKTFNNLRN